MGKFVWAAWLLFAAGAHAQEWVLLTSDETSRTLLDAASVERNAPDEVRFQLKRVHTGQKDMMGLQYNATSSRYVLDCQAGLLLFRQQFLLKDEEVVWTFPESGKAQKASMELPEAVIDAVCRPAADSAR